MGLHFARMRLTRGNVFLGWSSREICFNPLVSMWKKVQAWNCCLLGAGMARVLQAWEGRAGGAGEPAVWPVAQRGGRTQRL